MALSVAVGGLRAADRGGDEGLCEHSFLNPCSWKLGNACLLREIIQLEAFAPYYGSALPFRGGGACKSYYLGLQKRQESPSPL